MFIPTFYQYFKCQQVNDLFISRQEVNNKFNIIIYIVLQYLIKKEIEVDKITYKNPHVF